MSDKKIVNIAFSALFTAILCITAQISFVTPAVPLTLQTFGVALCGFMLSAKWSIVCIISYVALGSLGLPVFSAFQGGMQILLGPTGGFLWGFIILTVLCSLSTKIQKKYLWPIPSFAGLIICHLIGTAQYSIVTSNPLIISFLSISLPFILKDLISVTGAFFLSKYLKKHIKGFRF